MLEETRYKINAKPNWLQVKSENPRYNYKLIGNIKTDGKDSMIIIKTSSLDEGQIEKITKSEKTGIWNLYREGSDSNVILSEYEYKNNSLASIRTYNSSGELISLEERNDKITTHTDYYSSGGEMLFYQYLPESKIANNFKLNPEEELKEVWEMDTTEYGHAKQILLGRWTQYYPNGNIKEDGIFDTVTKSFVDSFFADDPNDPYNLVKGVFNVLIYVKNGEWRYYNKDGSIAKIVTYNMGQAKKD